MTPIPEPTPLICEGCGYKVSEYTRIRVTNGVLTLCRTCLDDMNRKNPALVAAEAEIADLRDAIRLIIGRNKDVPWHEVKQSDVDGYLQTIREYKAERRTKADDEHDAAQEDLGKRAPFNLN